VWVEQKSLPILPGMHGRKECRQRPISAKESISGKEHSDTLTDVGTLRFSVPSQGKCEAAEEMNRQVLEGREKALGKDHPNTLTSVSHLALVLGGQGRYEIAEEMN
jgi:hypothetical protein